MNSISTLNLGTALMGFIISGMLIFSAGHNRQVNRFLGAVFLILAYRSLSLFALQRHMIDNTFLMGSVSFAYYFTPPAIFLYFRSLIRDEQSLRKSDWIHFIIPIGAIVLLIYYIAYGYINYGYLRLPADQNVFNTIRNFPFHILPKYHLLLLFIMCIVYLVWSWKLYIDKMHKGLGEHLQAKKVKEWVMTLLITCSLLTLVVFYHAALLVVFEADMEFVLNPDILRSIILIFIFTRMIFKPELLFGLPKINTVLPVVDQVMADKNMADRSVHEEKHVMTGQMPEPQAEVVPEMQDKNQDLYFDEYGWIHMQQLEKHYQTVSEGPIEKDKVFDYIEGINKYLTGEPYTDPDFDMKSISNALQCPLYHIEYLYRYYNRYTFSEFRNMIRVQYVLRNFEFGLQHDYTMEGIGLKAGFNSRSSFFRVFKIVTGKTPKQFLEGIQENA